MAITKPIRELVAEATAKIRTLSVAEAKALLGRDNVSFVDLRDIRELWREGTVPTAEHAPRGMLEFWFAPDSPYHKPQFAEDKLFVLFCQSGWRSALAAATLKDMGLERVAHIEGGYRAWKDAGGATIAVEGKRQEPGR